MSYTSKRGVQTMDSLRSMLSTITDISKNTQNFDQLEQLVPLMTDLRKTDLDNKQMVQSLKTIGEVVSKLKTRVTSNRSSDSTSEVYDRMVNHLNFELNKLTSEVEDITNKQSRIQTYQQEQIKSEASTIIKEIQEILANSKKAVLSSISHKRKEFLNDSKHHYLYLSLAQRLRKNSNIRKQLSQCKYQLGQFRNMYNLQEINLQNSSLQTDIQQLKIGKETGMNEQLLKKLQAKIQMQKRMLFVCKCEAHLEKQYPLVLKNLRLLNQMENKGKYQQGLFHHYYGWGRRIKILLQSILIKLASFEVSRLNLRQEGISHSSWKQQSSKYQQMLQQLTNQLK